MYVDDVRLRYLLKKYLENQINSDELQELTTFVRRGDRINSLNDIIDDLWKEQDHDKSLPIRSEAIYQAILHHPNVKGNPPTAGPYRKCNTAARLWVAGIAASLLIGIVLFFHHRSSIPETAYTHTISATDTIVPGGNKATLTLADGQAIDLSAAQNGIVVGDEVTYEDGSSVFGLKTENKKMKSEVGSDTGPRTNDLQLSTPKGGTYQVTLSDGTKVWLNAASKLTYPSRFMATERIIELDGEAYFEVAPMHKHGNRTSPKIPFVVKTKNQMVQVIGTQFNVSAYADEQETRTTLVEGSVQIVNLISNVSSKLAPSEQSVVRGGQTAINDVETETYTAWKDGYFAFPDTHISHVMTTIARWYDIEIAYEGDMANKYFGGTISRFEDFKTLLKMIELTGSVRFKIEGRRVVVMT